MANSIIDKPDVFAFKQTVTINEGYAVIINSHILVDSLVAIQIQKPSSGLWRFFVEPNIVNNGQIYVYFRDASGNMPPNGTQITLHIIVWGGVISAILSLAHLLTGGRHDKCHQRTKYLYADIGNGKCDINKDYSQRSIIKRNVSSVCGKRRTFSIYGSFWRRLFTTRWASSNIDCNANNQHSNYIGFCSHVVQYSDNVNLPIFGRSSLISRRVVVA